MRYKMGQAWAHRMSSHLNARPLTNELNLPLQLYLPLLWILAHQFNWITHAAH